jgi:very-short-patch-repair endonuclease
MSAPKLTGVTLTTDDWQLRRDSVRQLIEAGSGMKTLFQTYRERFIEQAFESVVLGIRQGLVGRVDKWWRIFSGKYRRAKSDLQGYCKEPLNGKATEWLVWVDDLLAYQTHQKTFNEFQTLGESLFGAQWQGKGSDWEVLATISEWLFSLYDDIGKGDVPPSITQFLAGNSSLVDWQERLDKLNEWVQKFNPEMSKLVDLIQIEQDTDLQNYQHFNADELQVILDKWCDVELLYHAARFNQLKEDLVKIGLAPFADVAKSWDKPTASLTLSLKVCYYSGLVNYAYSKHASIQRFDRINHERLIKEFIETDSALFDFAQESLVSSLYEALPNFNAPGEMDLLRREISKKRRHISIRRLVGETATVLQQTKPVFMMSPMSVATYLPQGAIEFDLVIFDEASQIEAPDALGAIARGKQVVVVGDSKQMPPTNFFGRAVELSDDDAEESVTADIESILGMMLVRGASEAMLRWHYRSRHHSLITVSNSQFYNNKLMVFPSPGIHPDATGLKLHHLPNTTYDRGGSRTNAGEAEHIANAVMDHARNRSHLSLGVVAFSMAQREAILLCVERMRREFPDTEDFFKHHEGGDEFFIKNLENVQGDERDVIFISIGYGRSAAGNVSSSFGPVNMSGGERRLNVLISRARMAMEVFSNFVAEDMRTKADTPFGVKALKVFLKYAETGELVQATETGKEADSPFEEEVHDAIKSLGYEVEPQVGSSGFFIDLAVRDPEKPGRYILAVECDGASYHSSASARDRDRLRQGVLEGLGWRFHRIWSTDWFRNAAGEIDRLKESIEQSIAYYNNLSTNGLSVESRTPSQKAKVSIQREAKADASQVVIPRYIQTAHGSLALPSVDDFSGIDSGSLRVAIERIVSFESPIHFNVLTTRLINAAGFKKAGNKIRNNVKSQVDSLAAKGRVKLSGDFLLIASGSPVKMRDWSNLDSSSKKIEYVSDHELEISIHHTVSDAFSIGMDDCISAALSLLGFKRVTAIAKERMEKLISTMLLRGLLGESNSRLQLKGKTEPV